MVVFDEISDPSSRRREGSFLCTTRNHAEGSASGRLPTRGAASPRRRGRGGRGSPIASPGPHLSAREHGRRAGHDARFSRSSKKPFRRRGRCNPTPERPSHVRARAELTTTHGVVPSFDSAAGRGVEQGSDHVQPVGTSKYCNSHDSSWPRRGGGAFAAGDDPRTTAPSGGSPSSPASSRAEVRSSRTPPCPSQHAPRSCLSPSTRSRLAHALLHPTRVSLGTH